MNLSDIREAIRVRTGYPERGEVGTKRLNSVINQSLRNLWGEIPEVLLKDEYRLQLEPENDITVKMVDGDPKALKIVTWEGKDPISDSATSTILGKHLLQKTLNGRWIEWQHNGKWYHRRIAQLGLIYTGYTGSTPKSIEDDIPPEEGTPNQPPGGNAEPPDSIASGGSGPKAAPVKPDMILSTNTALGEGTPYDTEPAAEDVFYWTLIVTEPIEETTITKTSDSASTSATTYTYEYPYDADIQTIRRIVKNPENNPREIPLSLMGGEMSRSKIGNGWQAEGEVQYYARGDFFQLRAPHYTPEVGRAKDRATTSSEAPFGAKWGFQKIFTLPSTEMPDWGPAGEFSYVVCHVWGRFSPNQRQIDGARGRGARLWGPDAGYPFYISSPSKPSSKVSCNWGGQGIEITTPDIGYVLGYAQDSSLPSYQKSGCEKWIFRARHSVEKTTTPGFTGTGSINTEVETDEIYYLWRIIDGSQTKVTDIGDHDPVSRYRLKDFMGHYHLRFDKRPSNPDPVLVSCIRRPPVLKYDTDTPSLPPECYGCIIELACSYLLGDRDGDIKRKASYYDNHLLELQKLKRMYSFSGHERPSFSDGMSSKNYRRAGNYPITEIS